MGKRYLIHDRDPLFTAEFLETLAASGVQAVKLPPHSPNLSFWGLRPAKAHENVSELRLRAAQSGKIEHSVETSRP